MLDFTSQAVGIPVGLTSDLAQMVKRGAVNEQQARDMMEAKKITAGYFRQSERFIAWVNVIAKFRGCVSMLIAPSKQPVAISAASVNSKPTPPAALPPLTPDLYEMVAAGVMSEAEARLMMGSPKTAAAMTARLAAADEQVWRHTGIHS